MEIVKMKLTMKEIERMVLEVLNEHRGIPMKDRGMRGQQIHKSREEQNSKRTEEEKNRKERNNPALRALLSLGRGVIAESDLEEEEDWIKIKKKSLDALLVEIKGTLGQQCNKAGYKTMDQWLRITNAFADAGKGKFGEKQ
jgi:hypothetical protein